MHFLSHILFLIIYTTLSIAQGNPRPRPPIPPPGTCPPWPPRSRIALTPKPHSSWCTSPHIWLPGYPLPVAWIHPTNITIYTPPPPPPLPPSSNRRGGASVPRGHTMAEIAYIRALVAQHLLTKISAFPFQDAPPTSRSRTAWPETPLTERVSTLLEFPAPHQLDAIELRIVPDRFAAIPSRNTPLSKKLAAAAVKAWWTASEQYGWGNMRVEIWEWPRSQAGAEGDLDIRNWRQPTTRGEKIPRGYLEVEMRIWGVWPQESEWNA